MPSWMHWDWGNFAGGVEFGMNFGIGGDYDYHHDVSFYTGAAVGEGSWFVGVGEAHAYALLATDTLLDGGKLVDGALISGAKNRVFWSGGDTAKNAAEKWAIENNAQTLEMTKEGKNLISNTTNMPWNEARPLWEKASARFAKKTSGSVHIFQNANGVGINSIWATTEYPILNANNVNFIYHIVY